MKIGINGYYLNTPYSGIGQYSRNLLLALAEIDRENQYFLFTPTEIQDLQLPDNFRIIVIRPFRFFLKTFLNRYFWEEYQLGNVIKKYKIDVFHGLYQSLPRGVEKIGNVVTIHDGIPWRFPFERKKWTYRWYTDQRKKTVKERAKKVITVSETSKLDFAPIYAIKPETIEVTYESVNTSFNKQPSPKEIDDFKARYNIKRDFILYTGGLKRHKNLRMLIKSFDILVREHGYRGELYILGAIRNTMAISAFIYYKTTDLETYAKLKGVADSIRLIGSVSQEDMSLFMHLASSFVSISLYEGFGLPALEAMTSGTPSVLSSLGAYSEIADGAALFAYPYGPHRIAEALNSVLTNKELRKTLIENGFKKAKTFDRLTIAKRVKEIYKEVYDDYKISFQP